MSTASHKRRRSVKPTKPTKHTTPSLIDRQTKKNLIVLGIVFILAGIPFGLGKYIEFNTPGAFDSGGYVYSAKHVLDGAKLGVDEKPGAMVGTLLVNMLGVKLCGFNETGPELIQCILQAGALLLMFIAMRKLFGNLPAAVGVIIASVYLSAPLIAKFGNVKEQYMIACMVIGVSFFVLRQLGGGWPLAILAGVFLGWAPLFKPTGTSAVGAAGLFVLAQPILKQRSWKQTAVDIALMLTGAVVTLAPVYIWLIVYHDGWRLPYAFAWKMLITSGISSGGGDYIAGSHKASTFSQQWPRVLRYYGLLVLPIALGTVSIIIRLSKVFLNGLARLKEKPHSSDKTVAKHQKPGTNYERFVLLFAVWWLLDMAYVWISPRSYEQYYLPLNASAAMLSGYVIAVWRDAYSASIYKTKWTVVGAAGIVCMIIMSWHIFFGVEKSPHSGNAYGEKRRGYQQKLEQISQRKNNGAIGAWEAVSDYIRRHSAADDKIYVWGWVPGIYVQAQRFSPTPKAFEGTMHTLSPEVLSERIEEILSAFERQRPKFIVDTHKIHFPWDRPPLELWPRTQKGFLPVNQQTMDQYDAAYTKMLEDRFGADAAVKRIRYEQLSYSSTVR
jgi:hypothetical protein